MPASQKIKITKLGIIAGGGSLPAQLIASCKQKNIEPFVVGFNGQTADEIMCGHSHLWAGLGSVGKIIKYFKTNDIADLVMIGSIKRPSFTEIKPDLRAVKMLSRIGMKALGDNELLVEIKNELEREGFTLHGIQDFCDRLLVAEGALGRYSPDSDDLINIKLGLAISQQIGAMDIGQSVIVQNSMVIGVEAVEGTDALISRCADLLQKGGGGILVKTCKPQQDKSLDLPTIGDNTIINAHKAGLTGIALQANNVIITDAISVAKYADKYKIFVVGVNLN